MTEVVFAVRGFFDIGPFEGVAAAAGVCVRMWFVCHGDRVTYRLPSLRIPATKSMVRDLYHDE